MKCIRSVRTFEPKRTNGRTILYMHGYGGYTWQAIRQIKLLQRRGYRVVALDFKLVLHNHNPKELIDLMDEADRFLQQQKLVDSDLIIIGISLGGLVGFNMLRRHSELKKLIIITGGNIALLPTSWSLTRRWKLTRDQLMKIWKSVNMYTQPGRLKDRNVIMLLPKRDKIINPQEVLAELALHKPFNRITLIQTKGGHYRTIISQTILHPARVVRLINLLD